ncbi:nascent polypeptide-associated complex subunit alpha, muscle-specific form-like [Neopsephotus bourkii]|uniref:nascent polypeptide-associated complex subunit alpha, muscle-specific form-like n=1 Tax=Neopsephotus bourkii TaxID=309878 RepID=UPI002AA51BC5|nr:nascent polypeptide-associated complex subunit alpha, muscle-specific form-like [Neopsephotus bourkii]
MGCADLSRVVPGRPRSRRAGSAPICRERGGGGLRRAVQSRDGPGAPRGSGWGGGTAAARARSPFRRGRAAVCPSPAAAAEGTRVARPGPSPLTAAPSSDHCPGKEDTAGPDGAARGHPPPRSPQLLSFQNGAGRAARSLPPSPHTGTAGTGTGTATPPSTSTTTTTAASTTILTTVTTATPIIIPTATTAYPPPHPPPRPNAPPLLLPGPHCSAGAGAKSLYTAAGPALRMCKGGRQLHRPPAAGALAPLAPAPPLLRWAAPGPAARLPIVVMGHPATRTSSLGGGVPGQRRAASEGALSPLPPRRENRSAARRPPQPRWREPPSTVTPIRCTEPGVRSPPRGEAPPAASCAAHAARPARLSPSPRGRGLRPLQPMGARGPATTCSGLRNVNTAPPRAPCGAPPRSAPAAA